MTPQPKIHYDDGNGGPVCRALRRMRRKNPFQVSADTYDVTCLKCEAIISTVERDPQPAARSYVPTKAQTTAGNKFHSYMQGWRDGAGMRALRHEHGHGKTKDLVEIYLKAYEVGRTDANRIAAKAAQMFKYTPSILRIGPPGGPQ